MSARQPIPEFKLPGPLNQRLLTLAADLNGHGELLSRRLDRQPRAWRESEEGNAALGWLEDLDALIEAMNEFAEVIEK